jgi:hypothetical protein
MKKKESNSIMEMFNLPSYTKGKTFAEASKLIAKKFEGREDKESIATLQDLQGRLQQAQEYIKKQSQPTKQPQPQASAMGDTNDHFLGGIMSKLGETDAAGVAGAANTALDLGKMAFSKPNVDTSGATGHGAKTSQGASALGGAMKGAQAGMAFGPWGGAVGGVVGGVAGLIGGKKAQDAQVEADAQHSYAMAKEYNNDYAGGGFMDNVDPNELISMLKTEGLQPLTTQGPVGGPVMNSAGREIQQTVNEGITPYGVTGMRGLPQQSVNAGIESQGLAQVEPSAKEQLATSASNALSGLNNTTNPIEAQEASKSGYDPSTLLRYAPAVTDAYQLATLKKPDQVSRGRLGNKYQSQQVDETSLVKGVQEGVNNQRDAILGSSGGSQAAARANLLGLSLQGTKALSSAMQSAGEANRQDNRMAQQFNLGVDQTNLQQSNAEQLANEQNQGAYDTQKSQLISQLGSNLGEIGKEQLFKKYPELMGMDFDALGKYINGKNKKKKK